MGGVDNLSKFINYLYLQTSLGITRSNFMAQEIN
jgi:hypothetical protein